MKVRHNHRGLAGRGRIRAVDAKEWRTEIRGAIHRADGQAVVALARKVVMPEDALQLIGDGLLAAVSQQVEGAIELGADCAKALRQRAWYGDDDLADHLDAVLGVAPMPMLRPLPVDLADLAGILEGDELSGGGRIDRQTGEVWHQAAVEYAQEVGEEDPDESDDPERWIWVPVRGIARWLPGHRDVHRDGQRPRQGGPAGNRHPGPGCLPAVQGRARPLAGGTRAVVRLLRGSSTGEGPGVARRRRLPAVTTVEAGGTTLTVGNGLAMNSVAIAGRDDTRWTAASLPTSTFGTG